MTRSHIIKLKDPIIEKGFEEDVTIGFDSLLLQHRDINGFIEVKRHEGDLLKYWSENNDSIIKTLKDHGFDEQTGSAVAINIGQELYQARKTERGCNKKR